MKLSPSFLLVTLGIASLGLLQIHAFLMPPSGSSSTLSSSGWKTIPLLTTKAGQTSIDSMNSSERMKPSTLLSSHKPMVDFKQVIIPLGVSFFTIFSCLLPSTITPSFPGSVSSQVNAAETIQKQVSQFKVKETINGVKFFEVQKGSGESPHDGDLIIINYIGYLSDGTVFDAQHAPGKKPLAFQYGKNQVIPGLEDVLKTMQPGGERQVLVPPSMGYGERGVCLDKEDVNKEKCLIPPGSNLKFQLQLKRVAVSPI